MSRFHKIKSLITELSTTIKSIIRNNRLLTFIVSATVIIKVLTDTLDFTDRSLALWDRFFKSEKIEEVYTNPVITQPVRTETDFCFPNDLRNNDSLYILITRFEDYITNSETYCYGRSLQERIEYKARLNNLPISVCYLEDHAPKSISKAKELQKQENVDLVLWGQLKNMENDCSAGDFCFRSQPSENLINIVGGKVPVEKFDLNYENMIGPSEIQEGAFHVDSLNFDQWILAIYNIKIGNKNPDLYTIDKDLPPLEKANGYLQKGRLYSIFKLYTSALNTLEKALDLNGTNPEILNELGTVHSFLLNDSISTHYFSQAINLNPKNDLYYTNRGTIFYRNNQFEKALKDYKKAVSLDNSNVLAINNTGAIYYKLGNREQTKRYIDLAIKKDSSNSETFLNASQYYFEDKNYKKSEYYALKALNLLFNNQKALLQLSQIYSMEKNIPKFKEIARRIEIVYESDSSTYTNLCAGYYNIRDYENCLRIAKKIDLNTINDAGVFFAIGTSYYHMKNYSLASGLLSRAISIDKKNASYHFNRGMAYEGLNDYNAALRDFEAALKLKPNDERILEEIKYIKDRNKKKTSI